MMRGVLAAPPCRDMASELAERHIGIAAERCLPAACSAEVGIPTSKLREQAGQQQEVLKQSERSEHKNGPNRFYVGRCGGCVA